jgi:hypothetical protein
MAVQTQIQTRRGTAATWTSTNPTLAAGEIGFETDTNKFKIGTGSTAWTALAYAANTSPLTTKGDLYTYSTTNDRLAVGNNGETLVADSSATTGLRYQSNFAAGKNKIINGDMNIWQRGTSFTLSGTAYTYTADRWRCLNISGATTTVTRQTFTPGTAPVAGYEGSFYLSYATTDISVGHVAQQLIEDVRTFANQIIAISFWAKINTGTKTVSMSIVQDFGSGGSSAASVNVTFADSTLTTSWKRFTGTATIPSISGKTIGTGSNLAIPITMAAGNGTLDIWGVQLEAGSVATAFQTATGTLQGELAACQRYYQRFTASTGTFGFFMVNLFSTTDGYGVLPSVVTMRSAPTFGTTGTASNYRVYQGPNGFNTLTNIALQNSGVNQSLITITGPSMTAGGGGWVAPDAANNGYLELKAEL